LGPGRTTMGQALEQAKAFARSERDSKTVRDDGLSLSVK
jgi:hypothetical protein